MTEKRAQQKIHIEQLQATLEELDKLEEKSKEELSLRESIYFLRDKIKKALAKGYSYEDISKLLEKQKIFISPATLKQYISEINKEADKGKKTSKLRKVKQQAVSKTGEEPTSTATEEATGAEFDPEERQVYEQSEVKPGNLSMEEASKPKSAISKKVTSTQELTEQKQSDEEFELKSGKQSTDKTSKPKHRVLSKSNDTDILDEFNQY